MCVGAAGVCTQATYKSTSDPDYQALLKLVRSAAANAWAAPRRDVKALVGGASAKQVGGL